MTQPRPEHPSSSSARPAARRRFPLVLAMILALAVAGNLLLGLVSGTPSRAAAAPVELFSNSLKAGERVKTRKSMNIGVKFSSSRDGTISALQYYRSTRQKKAYTASLWSSNGTLLARTTFPKTSRIGWHSVALPTPVPISKGASYVASYRASDGQYGVIRGTFARPYTRDGLTVPKNGGLYNYSSKSKPPTKSHRSTNYLVDVVFTPADGSNPTPTPTATPTPVPTATGTTSPGGGSVWTHRTVANAVVQAALGKRVFFGHQSIGAQVLKGVTEYARDAGLPTPSYPDPESGSLPTSGGYLAQSYVAENGEPLDKIAEFDRILRSGVANRVDVAVLKFCYADIRTGGHNPASVFEAYRRTMAALERDYPNVTFLYATEPIVTAGDSDAPNNIPRAVFNQLVRAQYGSTGRLWDVAAIESSTLDGRLVTGTSQGTTFAALNPEFASPDGRHITGPGLKAVAGPLLELIAKA